MEARRTPLVLFFAAAAMILTTGLFAASLPEGTINVTVVDQNGAVVPDAPLYIYGEHKTHFVGGKDIPGTVTVAMPAGDYKISSSLFKNNGNTVDRYASHEAHINVLPGDNSSVILTLRPLNDPTSATIYAEMRTIGPIASARNF